MVALKRLDDAERDGDRIYAVINGVGSSSDGRAKSVYAPLPEGQARALRRAYALAGFGPEQVELVEAHGTGTKAGDAAEFKGLATAFAESSREDTQWCTLGSVKSQIGHAKAASAAAGLFKAVMALHHKVLPPTIKIERPNPALEIESSPFHLSTQARPWVRDARHPRRAGVSSFGFGGTNFHVALTEYLPREGVASRPAPRLRAPGCELVALSAKNPRELVARVRTHAAQCSKSGVLQWLARTSQGEFDAAAAVRLAVVASDEADLAAKLERAADSIESDPSQSFEAPTGIYYSTGQGSSTAGLAYLFSGQGSQYLHMGASVAMQFGCALGPWDHAANFEWDETRRLHHVVFPPTAFDDESKQEQQRTLAATEWAQPAIGCMSLSLLRLLDGLGLQADCFAGHSFGEVTALHAAGVLSEEDFLAMARRRGELMAQAAVNPGAMIAVAQPIERIRCLLEAWDTPVVIANHNAPDQVVLSGETSAIEGVEEKLAELQITVRRLPVATAFHSAVVAKAGDEFREYLDEVEFAAAKRPVYSNTSGLVHDANPVALRAKLAEQLARPVKFVDMIESMYEAGVRSFVEVGPGSVLTGLVGRILGDRPHMAVNLDRKGKDGVRSFFEALARISVGGHALDFASLWSEFAEPGNPNDRVEPKLKIPINGSNFGKPYPPAGGAGELPNPNPPREREGETVCVDAPSRAPAAIAAPMSRAPVTPPFSATPGVQQVAPFQQMAPAANPTIATSPNPSAVAPAWAQAYQDAQRQTAEAHVAYVQAMAQTHTAYLDTIDRSFQAVAAQAGLQPEALAPAVPRPQLQIPAAPTAQPVHVPVAPNMEALPAPAVPPAPASLQPMEPAPAVASQPIVEQPVAPSQAGGSDVDLHALLLEVVSDKTGYPPEMLTLAMELEADLGIDSIKRVEILSAMNDLAPGLPEVDTTVMAKLATLGDVVEYMNGQLRGGTSAAQAAAPSSDEAARVAEEPSLGAQASARGRYLLDAVEKPVIGMAQSGLFGDGCIVVTDEGSGVAEYLVAALEARGIAAQATAEVSSDDVRGVIFLGGLREVSDDVEATRVNREAFEVARAVAARFQESDDGACVFVTVQDTSGAFGTSDFEAPRAWLAGCAALARTVAQEWPCVSVKAIDIERADRSAQQIAAAIADELLLGGPDLDVGLSASGRRVVMRSRSAQVVRGVPVLKDGDVLVASGGARGVTAATLVALAGEANLRMVLLGRTQPEIEPACCQGIEGDAALKRELLAQAVTLGEKPTPAELGKQVSGILAYREVRATLAAIEEAGSEARYLSVDVTSLESVSKALAQVRAEWGDVAAIVHGAGVLADKKVSEKTVEQFDRVFDTKVEGLRTLLAATAADPLRLLCFFSSVAARCGNVGQVDYAMANEVLNKVAVAESRHRGDTCLVKSLGWGPWEGGMVSPQLKAHFESLGVPLIPLRAGAQMLVEEVTGSAPEQVELVLGGEPKAEALNPQSEGRVFSMDVVVGKETHPYLSDHSIQGTPVVPVTMVIEWFSRVAIAFGPELVLARLLDLKVLRGISLPNFVAGREHLVVHCKLLTNGSGATLALDLADRQGSTYYRCTAELVPQREVRQPRNEIRDLALEAWGDEVVYDGELLFHGPAFQTIRSIDGISELGIVAELSGIDGAGWTSDASTSADEAWTTDPRALDGGLQLALLWCKRVLGGASLPTGIEEIRTWADAPFAGPIRCTLTGREATGRRSVSDLAFNDASGHLVVEFLGVETHLLPDQNQA